MEETRILRIGYDRFLVPISWCQEDVDDFIGAVKQLVRCDHEGLISKESGEIEYSVKWVPEKDGTVFAEKGPNDLPRRA